LRHARRHERPRTSVYNKLKAVCTPPHKKAAVHSFKFSIAIEAASRKKMSVRKLLISLDKPSADAKLGIVLAVLREEGKLIVKTIRDGSVTQEAGVLEGDVLIAINDQPAPPKPTDATAILKAAGAGSLSLTVERTEKAEHLVAKNGDDEEAAAAAASAASDNAAARVKQERRARFMATVNSSPGRLWIEEEENWAVCGDVLNPQMPASRVVASLQRVNKTVHRVNPYDPTRQCNRDLKSIGKRIDAVNLCINSFNGLQLAKEAADLGVRKVFIQPGAESGELLEFLRGRRIEVFQGCVMVELGR
jgi:predicted CoA-binding protein